MLIELWGQSGRAGVAWPDNAFAAGLWIIGLGFLAAALGQLDLPANVARDESRAVVGSGCVVRGSPIL